MTGRRRGHLARWLAGTVLLVLVVVGIVLATRTPQEATEVQSPLVGKAVVLNFFASWCIPCQEEAPDLSRFYYQQSHASGGAQIVSVVFHDTTSTAKQFMVKNGDLWPALSDPQGAIAERYGVTAPPTTFVIDPAGKVTAVLEGPATQKNLDTYLEAARQSAARTGRA
jgi:cytochrome c biogenesis protein CcmG, thiol:disulfide interchange protein DsbE